MDFQRNPRYLPPQEEKHNILKGAVTPDIQKMHGRNVMSLSEIITNEELKKKFEMNTFPKIEKTTSGWFFSPINHSIFNMHQTYMKWFSLTKDGVIPHDHAYDFARLNMDGYLLKVSVPMLSNQITDFQVDYLVNTNSITPLINEEQDGSYSFKMPMFVLGQYPNISDILSNQQTFIRQYLGDVQEIIGEK